MSTIAFLALIPTLEDVVAAAPGRYVELALGALFIAIYAYRRFNTPVDKDTAVLAALYARDAGRTSTTRGRFLVAFLPYLGILLVIYYVFSIDPRWLTAVYSHYDISKAWTFSVPLMAALALTVLVPAIPFLSRAEQEVRAVLQRVGSIPLIVQDTIAELHAGVFPQSDKNLDELQSILGEHDITYAKADSGTLMAEYYECAMCLHRLERWKASRYFKRYTSAFGDVLAYIQEKFDELTLAINEDEVRRKELQITTQLREHKALKKQCLTLKAATYEFISRGLLRSGIGEAERRAQLQKLGFTLQEAVIVRHRAAFIFLLIWGTLVLSFLGLGPLFGSYDTGEALFKCATISSYFTIAAACGIALSRKQMEQLKEGAESKMPPYSSILVRSLIALLFCSVLSVAFKMAQYRTYDEAIYRFSFSYPYQLFTIATAFLTAWNLHSKLADRFSLLKGRIVSGAIQALATGTVGLVVWKWLNEVRQLGPEEMLASRLGVAPPANIVLEDVPHWSALCGVGAVIGFAIGFYVPHWFRTHRGRFTELHRAHMAAPGPIPAGLPEPRA